MSNDLFRDVHNKGPQQGRLSVPGPEFIDDRSYFCPVFCERMMSPSEMVPFEAS
jgi:hypothetical protein